jgi:hypothetical protein
MSNNGVRNKTNVRRSVKVAFVREHAILFSEAGSHIVKGHLTDAGRKVVDFARKQIGYSLSYTNMDLYRNLYLLYEEVHS